MGFGAANTVVVYSLQAAGIGEVAMGVAFEVGAAEQEAARRGLLEDTKVEVDKVAGF